MPLDVFKNLTLASWAKYSAFVDCTVATSIIIVPTSSTTMLLQRLEVVLLTRGGTIVTQAVCKLKQGAVDLSSLYTVSETVLNTVVPLSLTAAADVALSLVATPIEIEITTAAAGISPVNTVRTVLYGITQ